MVHNVKQKYSITDANGKRLQGVSPYAQGKESVLRKKELTLKLIELHTSRFLTICGEYSKMTSSSAIVKNGGTQQDSSQGQPRRPAGDLETLLVFPTTHSV